MRTLDDLLSEGVDGRRVLVRADLNVPLAYADDNTPRITDDGRIRASLPTISALAGAGAKVVVVAHLGRPKGEADPKYTLEPVAVRLQQLLGRPVAFATDTVGPDADATVGALAPGDVCVLENLRFDPRETSKDDAARGEFAAALARYADAYVSDGFGAVHRRHASVADVAALLPHYAGGLVLREVEVLRTLTENPERPYVVVLGGAKVSDKLGVIEALLPTVDTLLIGGGMCFTFLAAEGFGVGDSLLESDQVDRCEEFLASGKVVLPTDVVVGTEFSDDAATETVAADAIPDGQKGLDIGPATVEKFASVLAGARTVFWNGPMGVFEYAPYAAGTRGVAEAVAKVNGTTVVGGGDSAAAVRALGLDESAFGHISTGGGASLEYLEGRTLPGLAALEDE
jgi:phosphoglycerate kinase